MPEPATHHQGATATRLRPSRNGSAPPLPAPAARARPRQPAGFPAAITRLREMMRRIARRPQRR